MRNIKPSAGKLLTNNVILELHEYATINTLLAEGLDIELVQKSRTPGTKSPDIVMLGMFWELKSPSGKTQRAIEHALRRATHQAQNIVIDLRRTKVADKMALTLLTNLFAQLRSVRNLWIIDKQNSIVKLKKIVLL